jgi:hypothetical protein
MAKQNKESILVKAKVRSEMIGLDCYIPSSWMASENIKTYEYGEPLRVTMKPEKNYRSARQLDLVWACAKFTADNIRDTDPTRLSWDTKDKVMYQVRVLSGFVEAMLYLKNPKNGKESLQFIPRSISYENCGHKDACKLFDDALKIMGDKIGLTVEELVAATKEVMGVKA